MLGIDPTVPNINIGTNDYWLSFDLQTILEASVSDSIGSEFGVWLKAGSTQYLQLPQTPSPN